MRPFLAALFALAIFSGCGGTGAAPAPNPCPVVAVALPEPPQLLYPQAGATGVPDGQFTLVLSRSEGSATALAVGSSVVFPSLAPTTVPSPLPSAAATPQPSSAPAAYAVPALQPHTAYTVVTLFAIGSCPEGQESVGTFTTQ